MAEPDDELQLMTLLDDGGDRHQAISEILAELRGDPVPEGQDKVAETLAAEEPGPAAEPTPAPAPEPQGVEQDGESKPVAAPPASEPEPLPVSPAPHQRQAAQAGPRPMPHASTPRTLILLHAGFLLVVSLLGALGYHQVTATLHAVEERLDRVGAAQAALPGGPGRPVAPAPEPPRDPVLQVDEGLRYVQELEQADLHFEKGQYLAAAAGYTRALDVMPASWNDGAAAYRLGECHFRLQDYPRAINAYQRVGMAYPSRFTPRALFRVGEAYAKLKAYAKAREAFYDLLLRQERYGADALDHIQLAYYRIADCYRLEAEALARGTPPPGQPEARTPRPETSPKPQPPSGRNAADEKAEPGR